MDDEQPPIDPADRRRASRPAPSGDGHGGRRRGARGRYPQGLGRDLTTAAVVAAAIAGAVALGTVAGLLTLFGWGSSIVVGILVVGAAAAIRPRPVNGWLLVPVLALALPSAAVAISGVRVMPQRGAVVETPTRPDQIPDDGYRAGLGDLLVDLRSFAAADGDRIVIPARSDLGRTVVALPQSRCFALDVRWRTGNLRLPRVRERSTAPGLRPERRLSRLGQQSPGNRKRWGTTRGRMVLFGRAYAIDQGRWVASTADEGAPTLTLELASEGGSFVVRTYPDGLSPLDATDWPIDQKPPSAQAVRPNLPVATGPDRARRAQPLPRGVVDGVSGDGPLADRMREFVRDRQDFARRWARRVTGTCNPKGAFR